MNISMLIILLLVMVMFSFMVIMLMFMMVRIHNLFLYSMFPILLMRMISNSMFFFIMTSNMASILPYFHSVAFIMLTSTMAISLLLTSWTMMTAMMMKYISSMVLSGMSLVITYFMVLIEFISLYMRPITLGMRLSFNMISGHLLLSMISMSSTMILALVVLIMLELMVSIIQSFVWTMLLQLYLLE